MRKSLPLICCFLWFSIGICFSQSISDPLSQGTILKAPRIVPDPAMANSAQCNGGQGQAGSGNQGGDNSSSAVRTPTLTNAELFEAR